MNIKESCYENIIVGSGAAGYRTALALHALGEKNILVVSENKMSGTSRNAGSDKQTYYKLSLSGNKPDSVEDMAKDFFSGQCVDGDMAYCEAALSARGFYYLAEHGVPFPSNEYGAFMGYQTDHDTKSRATSAGPYTSKYMTEVLEKETHKNNISCRYNCLVIKLLVDANRVYGVLCLNLDENESEQFEIIWCENVILATGGPAGIYYNRVYPESQFGMSGMAFEAGIVGKNLTEWQFGLGSVNPRWNVSGTYMQAIPRFFSTDCDGQDECEFLNEYFETPEEMFSKIFLKGYQWPFDINKVFNGSSLIDILVYQETFLKGRKVFLDFRKNPGNKQIDFSKLSKEAREYLTKASALGDTPIQRLAAMNQPAINYYLDHGIDLNKEPLEITICAQHNNGGLSTDKWWETNIQGIFAVGEVCGSHGVTRPGGSALNAGQVGAIRASERIHCNSVENSRKPVQEIGRKDIEDSLRSKAKEFCQLPLQNTGTRSVLDVYDDVAKKMSEGGGIVRNREIIKKVLNEISFVFEHFNEIVSRPELKDFGTYYRVRDAIISQKMYLSSMLTYIESGCKSRGSALYSDEAGIKPLDCLPEVFRTSLDMGANGHRIEETVWNEGEVLSSFRTVRPLPKPGEFFETEWRTYRERMGIM